MSLLRSICLALTALTAQAATAQDLWRYDMLLNRAIIGEQTLRLLPGEDGALLIQTTEVEKSGWFSQFRLRGLSVEQLDPQGATQTLQSRVLADGRTWWSQVTRGDDGRRGAGHDLGELAEATQARLDTLDSDILSEASLTMADIETRTREILGGTSGEPQTRLEPGADFVTSLNALPFYLKRAGRIPGSLQLIDNEGLQVINTPIVDLGTQSMEIGGRHYTARHIKVAKADAGTHIWYNEGDEGPVVLMIAGKSGKKKFQISLKDD